MPDEEYGARNGRDGIDREETERGLRFAHVMLSVVQDQGNEAVAYVQAIAHLLIAKGIFQPEELEEPLEKARQEMEEVLMPRVRLAATTDKYTAPAVEIDCASRVHLCHARCCTFKLFLSKQDVDEGILRWDYGNPYWLKQAGDGYCTHSDPDSRTCAVHGQRPLVCRQFDCRNDKRIWLDFEQHIPAAYEEVSGDAPIAMAEVALHNAHRATKDGSSDGQ